MLLAVAVVGCTTAIATRTNADGTKDSIAVKSFLSSIQNGNYSNGTGMALSVSSATPDSQTILGLAGIVGDLGKAGMLMASKQQTNSGGVIITNTAPVNVIQMPATK